MCVSHHNLPRNATQALPSGEGFHGRGHGRIEEEKIEELVVLIANASMVLDGSKWQVETYIMIWYDLIQIMNIFEQQYHLHAK